MITAVLINMALPHISLIPQINILITYFVMKRSLVSLQELQMEPRQEHLVFTDGWLIWWSIQELFLENCFNYCYLQFLYYPF